MCLDMYICMCVFVTVMFDCSSTIEQKYYLPSVTSFCTLTNLLSIFTFSYCSVLCSTHVPMCLPLHHYHVSKYDEISQNIKIKNRAGLRTVLSQLENWKPKGQELQTLCEFASLIRTAN